MPTGTVVSTMTSAPRLRCGAIAVDGGVEQREVRPVRGVDVDRHDEHDDVGVGDGVARVGRRAQLRRWRRAPGIFSSSPGSPASGLRFVVDLGARARR